MDAPSATAASPVFWSAAGYTVRPGRWQSSNAALARWLADRRRNLGRAAAMAAAIRRDIDALAPQMAALCSCTCRFCPAPCCITNTVWFDFRDLLYLHLTAAPVPPRQAAADPGAACPFLTPRGCRLPPVIRPWMCTRYVCRAQRRRLRTAPPRARPALQASIERIDRQRFDMEAAVMQAVRPTIGTSPSSSPASGG